MAVVELEALTKFFGTAAAVDDLTLTVAHGSLCCLLGPSGCGKTTTLRLVAGFIDPDRGTIRVGGRTVSQPGRNLPPERRGMSMIFQSAALARALVVEPETLLLDEPLSNLDANLREEMRFEIRRLHDAYKYTTIYVTHDQAEAMTTADTIVVMNRGRVEQVGSPEDIYQRPRSEFVARFIGGTNILRGRRIGADLVDCGAVVLRCG